MTIMVYRIDYVLLHRLTVLTTCSGAESASLNLTQAGLSFLAISNVIETARYTALQQVSAGKRGPYEYWERP